MPIARMTNASQSNTEGSYKAFDNFGSYSGGLALQLKYSYYRKSVATGGISDPAATEASRDVTHGATRTSSVSL
jgi:hypothetical protein